MKSASYYGRRIAFVSAMVVIGQLFAADPTSRPDIRVPNPLSIQIQQILDVRDTGIDLLPALANAISSFGEADGAASAAAVQDLVDVLNRGTAPNALNQVRLSRVVISDDPLSFERDPTWKYGTTNDRMNLIRLMWVRAQAMRDKSAEDAARYARAALLLAGQEDFTHAAVALRMFAVQQQELINILRLPEDRQQALVHFFEARAKWSKEELAALDPALEAMDRLLAVKTGEKIPAELTKDIITALVNYREIAHSHMQAEMEIIIMAWDLRNEAVKRNDSDAVAAVDAFLSDWERGTDANTILQEWIKQAQHNAGEPRRTPRIIRIQPK